MLRKLIFSRMQTSCMSFLNISFKVYHYWFFTYRRVCAHIHIARGSMVEIKCTFAQSNDFDLMLIKISMRARRRRTYERLFNKMRVCDFSYSTSICMAYNNDP